MFPPILNFPPSFLSRLNLFRRDLVITLASMCVGVRTCLLSNEDTHRIFYRKLRTIITPRTVLDLGVAETGSRGVIVEFGNSDLYCDQKTCARLIAIFHVCVKIHKNTQKMAKNVLGSPQKVYFRRPRLDSKKHGPRLTANTCRCVCVCVCTILVNGLSGVALEKACERIIWSSVICVMTCLGG